MSLKQKMIAVILSVLLLGTSFYLLFITYNQSAAIDRMEAEVTAPSPYILNTSQTSKERYKIMNIIYEKDVVYAIIHLDNGNIKVVQLDEAFVDPTLKNLNEGYLYRENGQIYIRAQ